MDPRQAIAQIALQSGVNPAYLMAIAERESSFNPNARASQTIHGLFQMSRPLRQKYGIGDSTDPETQTRGFMAYADDLRKQMAATIGRNPTDPELYLGHHFGPWRAARMIGGQIGGGMPVNMVFTPRELRENPHIVRAGTVGALTSSILADMNKRINRHGATPAPAPAETGGADFSDYGNTQGGEPADFSEFGDLVKEAKAGEDKPNQDRESVKRLYDAKRFKNDFERSPGSPLPSQPLSPFNQWAPNPHDPGSIKDPAKWMIRTNNTAPQFPEETPNGSVLDPAWSQPAVPPPAPLVAGINPAVFG